MPGGDRTGPAGLGPMTGRAAGYCAGYSVPGYMNPIPGRGGGGFGYGRGGGRGRGWGRGGGRGFGWRGGFNSGAAYPGYGYPTYAYGNPYGGYSYPPEMSSQQEAEMLNEDARVLKEQLADVQGRIQVLEKAQAEESKDK